jgi:hypothetical protein
MSEDRSVCPWCKQLTWSLTIGDCSSDACPGGSVNAGPDPSPIPAPPKALVAAFTAVVRRRQELLDANLAVAETQRELLRLSECCEGRIAAAKTALAKYRAAMAQLTELLEA